MASADYKFPKSLNMLIGFHQDQKFFSRRGGRQSTRSELQLRQELNQNREFSKTVGVSAFTSRSLYRIGPSSLQHMVHEYQSTQNLLSSDASTVTNFPELEVL